MQVRKIQLPLVAGVIAGLAVSCDGDSSGDSPRAAAASVAGEVAPTSSEAETREVENVVVNVIPASARIDPQAEPFVLDFLAEATARDVVVNLEGHTVEFRDLGARGAAGVCFYESSTVVLDNSFRSASSELLYELIIHELGHCALGMEHRPNSIMQAVGFSGVTEALLDEFFTERFFFEVPGTGVEVKYP